MLQSDYKLIRNTQKVYPTHIRLLEFKKPFGVSIGKKNKKQKHKGINIKMDSSLQKALLIEQSLRRTKTTIKDIILCNNFSHFCTFTFKDNRSNVDICKSRMQYWLQSQQKTYGAFNYLIVPEYHADGESLHFHALFDGYKGKIAPAVRDDGSEIFNPAGKQVFKLPGWHSGFSHAVIIDQDDESRGKVASYVTKYITKEMPVFHGKKRYWVSSSLARPIKSTNVDILPFLNNDNVQVFDNEFYTIYVVEKDKTLADLDTE